MSDHDEQKISPLPSSNDPKKYPSSKNPANFLCTLLLILLILVGVVVLIAWLIYRPQKPKFSLVGAAIYELNVTSPPYMSTNMQFTVLAINPNRRVRLHYDQFSVLVYYKGQPITPPLMLPPLFQKTKSRVILSPVIKGVSVEVTNRLMIDEVYGVVALRLVFIGKMRYKAGIVWTKHYGVYVKCDMLLVGFHKGFLGQVPLLRPQDCQVDI